MYKLTLKCRLITPMFMAGADNRTPELRSSEFKGMMRWWWRAIKAENDIEKLKKEEAEIFGGTGEGEGRSKVQMRLRPKIVFQGNNIEEEIDRFIGLKYLYYSTFSLRAKGQPIIRRYFKPNTEFEISIFSFNEKSFLIACASLWLAIYLGGFGTRARRGGGNIKITQADKNNDINLDFICDAQTPSQLKEFLKNNLTKIKKICGINTNPAKPDYTNLKGARILIFDPNNDWKEALNFLGKKYKGFRTDNKSQMFETATFGMPVMHSRFSVRMVPYVNRKDRLSERWASPLIFKVIKLSNKYFPVIVKLSSGGVDHIGKEKSEGGKWKLENDDVKKFTENLINQFLNNLAEREELVL